MTNKLLKSKKWFLIWLTGFIHLTIFSQTPKGSIISGTNAGEYNGKLVCMPDANTIAIKKSKRVSFYTFDGFDWISKRKDIGNDTSNDGTGYSISMPDPNTIAIGDPYNSEKANRAGQVRVFVWKDTIWVQKGSDINGEALGDWSGRSVSMPDANTIAIGAPQNNGTASDAGHARVYTWKDSIWVQKGPDIDGEASGDRSGECVNMPDSNTIAIGGPLNRGNGFESGHTRIYTWNGSSWVQKGTDIDGESEGDNSGWTICMPDPKTIAIGAYLNDGSANASGHTRVYVWNDTNWLQKGLDIDGEGELDLSGGSLSMPDSNTVAIGAHLNDNIGTDAGHTRVYAWNGSSWVQKGMDIDGLTSGENSGYSVSMPDANTLAIGTPNCGINGKNSGQTRIYNLNNARITGNTFNKNIKLYPNPTNGEVNIELNNEYRNISLVVRNSIGQELFKSSYRQTNKINIHIEGDPGFYILELKSDNNTMSMKITKN